MSSAILYKKSNVKVMVLHKRNLKLKHLILSYLCTHLISNVSADVIENVAPFMHH